MAVADAGDEEAADAADDEEEAADAAGDEEEAADAGDEGGAAGVVDVAADDEAAVQEQADAAGAGDEEAVPEQADAGIADDEEAVQEQADAGIAAAGTAYAACSQPHLGRES